MAAFLAGLLPLPVAGSELGDVPLGTGVVAVAVNDLDGDGATDVVAVLSQGQRTVLDAWTHADGAWRSLGPVPIPIEGRDGRSRASGFLDGMGLVTVRDGGARETLLLVVPDATEPEPGDAVLSVVEVRDGQLGLRRQSGTFGPIEQVFPTDVDGDGRDELIATERITVDSGEVVLHLLRRAESGWSGEPISHPDLPTDGYVGAIADTDGVPGSDLFVTGGRELGTWRVAIDAGGTHVEQLPTDVGGLDDWAAEGIWVTGAVAGRMIVTDGGGEVVLLTWPRGSPPRMERRLDIGSLGQAPVVIGSGAHERVVITEASGFAHGPIRIFDRDLASVEARLDGDPIGDAVGELLQTGTWSNELSMLTTTVGTVPFALEGGTRAAWLSGSVAWVDADGQLRVEPAPPILGASVVGSAGPGDGWLVLAGGWPTTDNAFLRPFGTVEGARLAVVPRASLIGEAALDLDAGIRIERLDGLEVVQRDRTRIASGEDGFRVQVSGPPESIVLLGAGGNVQTLRLTDEPLEVVVRHPAPGRQDRSFRATMVVVAPNGRAAHRQWDALIVREAPVVSASAITVPGELAATVTGTVEQTGGTVLVDGTPVSLAPDGSFEVRVDAPLWPRGVEVVARDIVGAEARTRVEVLGLVDYRGWPWAALAAMVTLAAGATLYLRIPRSGREPAASDDVGELEEIVGE